MKNFKLLIIFTFVLFSCSKLSIDYKNKYVIASMSEPNRPLIPADTYETEGTKIVDLLFSGLFSYDEQGSIVNEVAKSVQTKDNQHYIIKIKNGAKFADGSAVKSHNFVDAWNLAVKEKLMLTSFFSDIQGYPKNGENFNGLTGLKIIDDNTFSIDLKYPVYDFKDKLGYVAFYPMHDLAFKDIKAYGQNPIGNGPYKLANKDAWVHNKSITLTPNKQYQGPRKAKNNGILFKVYTLANAAYADLLSDQLDVLEFIPIENINTYHDDLNNRVIDKNSPIVIYLSINFNVPHFKNDKEGNLRRKAISKAIDREEITKVIFHNTRHPAQDFLPNNFSEYHHNLKGVEVLKFNPKKAKELWNEADKISKFKDVFSISYNHDGGHRQWIEAVANQLRNNLNIKVSINSYPDFKSFLNSLRDQKIKYAYREGVEAVYPSATTYLNRYLSNTSLAINTTNYNNPKFDKLFLQALQAKDFNQYKNYIEQSQEILLEDLPNIPLWYGMVNLGFSKNVKEVKVGWSLFPLYYNFIKK